jgi:hypothetical protein
VDRIVEPYDDGNFPARSARNIGGKRAPAYVATVGEALDRCDMHGGAKPRLRRSCCLEQPSVGACPDPRADRACGLEGRSSASRVIARRQRDERDDEEECKPQQEAHAELLYSFSDNTFARVFPYG